MDLPLIQNIVDCLSGVELNCVPHTPEKIADFVSQSCQQFLQNTIKPPKNYLYFLNK